MKRTIKYICFLSMLTLLVGCNSGGEIEADTSKTNETNKSFINKKTEILVKDFAVTEVDEEIDNMPMYHLIIEAKDNSGNILWDYKTENGIRAELEANQFLGKHKEKAYISESGTIIALDLNTGKEAWRNSDFESGGICFTFDDKDSLYFTGYYSGDIYGIDKDGKTLLKAPLASGWCHKIISEGNYLKIYSAGEGDYFYINKNDGSLKSFNYFPDSTIEGLYSCKQLNKAGAVLVDVDVNIYINEENKLEVYTGGYFTVNVSDGNGNYYDPEEAPIDAAYNLRETGVAGYVRQVSKNKYEAFVDLGFEDYYPVDILQINDTQIKTSIFSDIENSWIFTKEK